MTMVHSDAPTAREHRNALYDYFKHLTTLSTGAIVIVATFLEGVFQQPRWSWLVVSSMGGFLLSVLVAAWAGFLVGMISLAVFAARNLV